MAKAKVRSSWSLRARSTFDAASTGGSLYGNAVRACACGGYCRPEQQAQPTKPPDTSRMKLRRLLATGDKRLESPSLRYSSLVTLGSRSSLLRQSGGLRGPLPRY
eukprot:scaffold2714_cov413-Prasinococcus_capsulatus_cf.AAC.3